MPGGRPTDEPAAVWVPTDDLVPWADNPRKNAKAIPEVVESIKRFGFAAPIIARKADKMVIAGHTRLAAAKSLKLDRVPVRYVDLDPADARLLALADNKIGEIADWDDEGLARVLAELEAESAWLERIGFAFPEVAGLDDTPPDVVDSELRCQILIECANEHEQLELLTRFEQEGIQCRALMS